jgi:hypothetical protein
VTGEHGGASDGGIVPATLAIVTAVRTAAGPDRKGNPMTQTQPRDPADTRPQGVLNRVVNFAGRLLGAFEVARAVGVAVVRAFRRPGRRTGPAGGSGTAVATLPR